ncbi:AlbA family DNA-binding domain-containing protein [Sharpea azabuensis]|uniref:Putative DNA-binding domain-containing protein n=1 Tax=Sharpea azabuensis TaxID=322505 RepID=A0A1H6QQT3_9FIRM|nr:ATP-binding protein [Sharpea azabuensis]SEI42587.1 Putative DNA-binding domain-containing protein [Sharpea azabuensis]
MRYSKLPLDELISFFLKQKREGEFWDFKQEWHEKTEDLLKDIICFANTVHDEDCFIIFGIADDLSITGMAGERKKQADIIDTISNLSFAGDNLPSISLESLIFQDVELDVLRVYNTNKTPVYLKKQYGKMRPGCIYARIGDKNTPDNGNAEIGVIENLWRKRFGLTKAPLDYIFDELVNKLNWVKSDNGYYNIYLPEYTLECSEEDYEAGRRTDEFYSYVQTNESTSYYMMDIKARGTTLESFQIVILDGGRLSIPVPEWRYVNFDKYHRDVIKYKCVVKGSHIEQLMQFMYDPENPDERLAFTRNEEVILFFESEIERNNFENYIKSNKLNLKKRINSSNAFDYIKTECEAKTNAYKKSIRTAIVLKDMLEEFRGINKISFDKC